MINGKRKQRNILKNFRDEEICRCQDPVIEKHRIHTYRPRQTYRHTNRQTDRQTELKYYIRLYV